MRFEPLEDRIMVLRDEAEKTYKGVIIIPDERQGKMTIATVVAVSAGQYDKDGKLQPPLLRVGDRIMFGKYSGTDIKLDDVEYTIMRQGDVLGVLHDSNEVKEAEGK